MEETVYKSNNSQPPGLDFGFGKGYITGWRNLHNEPRGTMSRKRTEKQVLARSRNWSKCRLKGALANINTKSLTDEEVEAWKRIRDQIDELLRDWDAGSRALGLNVRERCDWCRKPRTKKRALKQHRAPSGRERNLCPACWDVLEW